MMYLEKISISLEPYGTSQIFKKSNLILKILKLCEIGNVYGSNFASKDRAW